MMSVRLLGENWARVCCFSWTLAPVSGSTKTRSTSPQLQLQAEKHTMAKWKGWIEITALEVTSPTLLSPCSNESHLPRQTMFCSLATFCVCVWLLSDAVLIGK